MPEQAVVLSPSDSRTLQTLVRWWRRQTRNGEPARRGPRALEPQPRGPNVQYLRVTSTAAGATGYPALVLAYDAETDTYSDLDADSPVLLAFANGYVPLAADVSTPTRFEARQYGPAADGRPVFVSPDAASVTGTEFLRVTSTSAGAGGYPALVQNLSGGAWSDVAGTAWVVFPNGYIPLAVDVSGRTRYLCRRYGPVSGAPVFASEMTDGYTGDRVTVISFDPATCIATEETRTFRHGHLISVI